MLANPHVAFVMLSFRYVEHLGYLLHIIFPFLGILYHYVEFDLRIMAILKKLLDVGSFSIMVGHLTCY
jgi:hypothetical protein